MKNKVKIVAWALVLTMGIALTSCYNNIPCPVYVKQSKSVDGEKTV